MQKKKILLITDAWYPQVNGVVRTVEMTIKKLEERGHSVALVHPGLFRTVPFPPYPEIRLALFPRRAIERAIREEKPDHIHIETEATLGWSARKICRRQGIPFTSAFHTYFQLHGEARMPGIAGPIMWMLRKFHSASSGVMASTESLKKMLEEDGFTNIRIRPLGVDERIFQPSQKPAELKKPVFLFFSRLAVEKNPDEFFRLDLPGTKLIIGDGPDRPRLERRYGGPDTVFVGYKRRQALVDLISAADVMVFPSRTETFGLVCLEALACGVPVAAHDVSGVRDIITPGVDGCLGEDLKECAMNCLSLDRTKCREKALRYTWDASVDAFLANLVAATRP